MAIIVPSLGLGTDFRHSNSFSFSYQVRDEYQKRPSYVLLSLALRCIFSSKYCSFLSLTWLVRRACLDLICPTDRRLLSLARLLVPGAKHQMTGARCYFLWPRRARYQLSPMAWNQLLTNQRQVVPDLSLARVIVLQLSAACASPGFLNCHTLSVFGQHRGISLKIRGTETETATRHWLFFLVFWTTTGAEGPSGNGALQKEGLRFNNTGNERSAHARGNITS